jgi:16S rRNA (uracil1498-N3)-methyltransferase
MTRRRFYAPVESFSRDGKSVVLRDDEARHLRDVLRLKPGYQIYVFDGAGREVQCEVAEIDREVVLTVTREVDPAKPESPLKITLVLALLKSDKFDLVVQKATELGVVTIVPLITRHADIRLRDDADADKRVVRWQRIALEAAKQSGRALVPVVRRPIEFESFVANADPSGGFLFSERDGMPLNQAINETSAGLSSVTAIVGPEGGWNDEELSVARDYGWRIVTFGGRTLRAETAAIVVTALLQHSFGDLS